MEKNTIEKTFEEVKSEYENGNKNFIEEYAIFLRDGKACGKNIELSIKLFEEAINNNSTVISTVSLGFIYRDKRNFQKAFEYYCKAEKLDGTFHPEMIANCYYYGIGIEKNKIKALEILKQINLTNSTKKTIQDANYMIGKIYLEGEIVEKSIEKSRYYLELANEDNDHRNSQDLLLILGRNKDLIIN